MAGCQDSSNRRIPMLVTKERRPAIRTLRGWAISVLQEAGALRECETHGWMQDRADPHARERAFEIASLDPPDGLSRAEAVAENRGLIGLDRRHLPRMPAGQLGPAPADLRGRRAFSKAMRLWRRES